MGKITYSKPVLPLRQFVKETGFPEELVRRAVAGKRKDYVSFRTSSAPNAKTYIYCAEFEECMREGEFR